MLTNSAAVLHGITIKLYEKTQTDTDPFGNPVYSEHETDVDNVIVAPATEQEVIDTMNLTGRKIVYTMGIPKGDTHDWTNVRVSFFGRNFRTVGEPVRGIEAMIPLNWHKKVRCEAINGESQD